MLPHHILVYSFSKILVISGKCSVLCISSNPQFFFKEVSEFIDRWASVTLQWQEKGSLRPKPAGSCSPLCSLESATRPLSVWSLGSLLTSTAEIPGWFVQLDQFGNYDRSW